MDFNLQVLKAFMREEDHQLETILLHGPRYSIRKHYASIDDSGSGRGRPVTEITINVRKAYEAANMLGSRIVSNRDGRIFVLHAEHVTDLPSGYRMHFAAGIRVGQYNVTCDECYCVQMPDETFVQAATERGLRVKLAKVLTACAETLSRPEPRVAIHIQPRQKGYVRPEIVIGQLDPAWHDYRR